MGQKLILSDFVSESSVTGKLNGMLKKISLHFYTNLRIRKFIDNELKEASVSHVEIERAANRINIAIHTGKPGMVIGKGGSEIEKLRNKLNNLTDKKYTSTLSKSKIDIDARLVAENIARQLENRASFRRVQNKLFQEL